MVPGKTTSHGSLTLNADGSFSYTPTAGFWGTDSFTYGATDGIATSAQTTVTIIVYSVPEATADAYTTIQGQTLSINAPGVLANDTTADGGALSVALGTTTSHGSLTLNVDGSFSYTPAAGFSGTDSFTYTAADGSAVSAPATVTLTVYSIPVANADAYGVVAGQTLAENAPGVLGNDTNADGGALTAALVMSTSHGNLAFNADGSFSYTPSTGYSGTDSFTYTAADAYAVSAPATVTLTVYSVPVATADTYTMVQGQTLTVNTPGVLGNDTNADGGTLCAELFTAPNFGSLTLHADGSFSYTPITAYWGTDSFTYLATDGNATSTPTTVTLTIFSIPVANADAYTAIQGQELDVAAATGVLANDANSDGNPLSAMLDTAPAHGQLTFNADGSFSYLPDAGFWGADSFTYIATDGNAISAPATVTLTVSSVPLAAADAYALIAGRMLSLTAPGVLANDTNADGNALTATLATLTAHGSLTLNADGSFLYTPNAGFFGTDSFTYTATDGIAGSVPATVTLTVYSVPVAAADTYSTIQGQELDVATGNGVLANDTNADENPLSATRVTAPAHGQLTFNADGSFSYIPDAGFWGTDSFTYSAANGPAFSVPALVTLTVDSIPLANADAYALSMGQTLTIDAAHGVLANDTNADGRTLSAKLVSGPNWGQLTMNADGSFSYTPSDGYWGTDSFTYSAMNGNAASAPATVTLTVSYIPLPTADAYLVAGGTTLTVNAAQGVMANDGGVSGETLTVALNTPPTYGNLTFNADGSFSYTPNGGFFGTDSFTYVTTDGLHTSPPALVTLTVYSIPVGNADTYAAIQGQELQVTAADGVLANDSNADGRALSAMQVSNPNYGTLTLNADGSFSYTPNPGFYGRDFFYYIAQDSESTLAGLASSVPTEVVFTIYAVPVANADAYTVLAGQTLTTDATDGVLVNDTNADGNALTAQLVTGPANGQLTLNADGTFSYTPNDGFIGTDGFTYTASNGPATSGPATVTLTVSAVPVANNATYPVIAGTTLTADAAQGVLATASDATSAALVYDVIYGTLTLNPDGSFSYLPSPGFWGTDSFEYSVSDGVNISAPATVSIDVFPEDESYDDGAGQTLTTNAYNGLLWIDNNPEGGAVTTALLAGPANGQLTLNADGTFTYLPNNGFVGMDSFSYTVTNGLLTTGPATATITVYAIPVANDDAYSVAMGSTLTVDTAQGVLANDSDTNGGLLGAWPFSYPNNGQLTFNIDGSFTYQPYDGFSGTDSFQYIAWDILTDSNVATVTITVDSIPLAANDAYSTISGQTLTISAANGVLANDTNADGNPLSATLVTGPNNGQVILNSDGSFSYTSTAGFSGPDTFTYTAVNGAAVSNTATVTITVLSPITAVTLNATPAAPVLAGTPVHLTATPTNGIEPEYKFYALYPVNGKNQQVLIQDYALNSTCTWTPTLAANYTLVVCAREHGTTVAYAVYNTVTGYLVKPIPVPTLTSFTPSSAGAGTVVTISGTNFTGANAVAFGGTAATFTVVNATTITATVGSGTTGTVSVTTAYGTASSSATFHFAPPITAVTFSAIPISPAIAGSLVSLTAVATGGYAPEYKFYALYPVGGVNQEVLIQDYALSSTCTWTPTLPAKYTLVVCTREHGTTVAYAVYNTIAGYFVNPIPLPTITSFTPSSAGAGTVVTINGTNFTGANAVTFGGTAAASFTVVSATRITATVGNGATGTVSVTTPYGTANSGAPFTFVSPLIGVTLGATPSAPLLLGMPVSLTAIPTGGIEPEYKFYALYPVNGKNQEVLIQDYALNNSCTWTPTLAARYTLVVCVREHGSTVAYAVYTTLANYTVIAATITSFTPDCGYTGSVVTITGSIFSGVTGVAFGGTPAASFTVVNATTITATVGSGAGGPITVITAGGTLSSSTSLIFAPPITAVSLSVTPKSPVTVGTPVTLSAVATGGNVPEYKFYALYPVGGVNQTVLIQDYALSSTCTWTPTLAGTYTIVVCAREHGSTIAEAAYTTAGNYIVK